jgi:MFS family permease
MNLKAGPPSAIREDPRMFRVCVGMMNDKDKTWVNDLRTALVVCILTLAYTCAVIDRQVLTLLVEPLRRDLHISDTEVSLLGGVAFTVFYTICGIPLARLADQTNRRNLIAIGLALWSAMTVLCGFAQGFWSLIAARVGVGIGEAALSPAAYSLLADYFPRRRLARAISAYSTGIYFGAGLALVIGGTVIRRIADGGVGAVAFLASLFPWQVVFLVVGALGLPVLLLMLAVREPLRRGISSTANDRSGSAWPALRAFLQLNSSTLSRLIGGFTLYGIAIGVYLFWAPTMMIRSFGWSASRTGFTIGLLFLIFGTAGVFAGGWIADRLSSVGREDAIPRTAFFGVCCGLPFLILAPLMPDPRLASVGLGITIFFLAFPQGLPAAAIQIITPNHLRAQVSALYFFVANLLATALGPLLPALLTDHFYRNPLMLRYAIATVVSVAAPLGGALLYSSLRPYRASLERASPDIG